jgi:signal transduction histidine kinase
MGKRPNSASQLSGFEPNRWAPASRVSRFLYRHISIVLLLLVLLGEVGVGTFVIRDLVGSYAAVQKIYLGSVQGLRGIGELQYQAQETRRSTLYALTTNDGNLQVSYADQSREADRRVTRGISEYMAQARTDHEIGVGERLTSDWTAYLKVRDDVLGLILESSTKEAVDHDLNFGVPLFERVRQDLDEIKRLYDEEASQQLAAVGQTSWQTMEKVITVLAFGLLFGTIAIWAIQKNKVRATMQIAKLQMEFVASVSHELRTPITAILTAGENIRDGMVLGRHSLFEQGKIITEQATQLMDLVDQVLLFAATSDTKPLQPLRELQVPEVVDHAIGSTEIVLREAGFRVETELEPELSPIVGDLAMLSQCLQNLILNAMKYSGRERWIAIVARRDWDRQEIQISVQDHGFGINDEDLLHIFEPFYRSPQVVAARIHGTGLGLCIAKRTAEIFGGRLTVITRVGVGSTFTLHLPIANPAFVTPGASADMRIGTGQ